MKKISFEYETYLSLSYCSQLGLALSFIAITTENYRGPYYPVPAKPVTPVPFHPVLNPAGVR